MSNVITDVREAVEDHLRTALAGVTVQSGRSDGVNRDDAARVSVWHPGYPVDLRNRTLARPTLIVRYFPTLSKQPEAASPRAQAVLEQAEADLLAAFGGMNRAGDFVDDVAVSVSGATLNDDPARWYVELTLVVLMLNLAQPAA